MSKCSQHHLTALEQHRCRPVHRAFELGVTHIDTDEVYGPFHSEELVGNAIKGQRVPLAWLLEQGDDIDPIPDPAGGSR